MAKLAHWAIGFALVTGTAAGNRDLSSHFFYFCFYACLSTVLSPNGLNCISILCNADSQTASRTLSQRVIGREGIS